jgi:mannose-6-phosphate isomerase-like protein (cupin superfamily)
MKPFHQKIEKPWGYELIFTPPESPTVAKLLHLNSGARFSLQYHQIKEETIVLVKGRANIYLGETKETVVKDEMLKNHGYFINSKLIHRCEAITECDILESSTKEDGTTVRLEDDYNRKNESEEERIQIKKI